MDDSLKPKRRWHRFSLRSLMLLMLLASIGMGWVAARMREVKKQREFVTVIKALGGWVGHDYDPDDPFDDPPPVPAWLRTSLGNEFFTNIIYVRLSGDKITDNEMKMLVHFPQLHELNLTGTNITDAGTQYLIGMNQLRNLHLNKSRVSNAGVNRLRQALPKCDISYEKAGTDPFK